MTPCGLKSSLVARRSSLVAIVLSVISTPGCLDYLLLKEVVDPEGPEDTGTPPPEPIFENECFDPFDVYQGDTTPEHGWTDYAQGACIANMEPALDASWYRVGAREINEYRFFSDTLVDRYGAQARLLAAVFGASSGWDHPDSLVSDDSEVFGSGPWIVIGEEGTMNNLNTHGPNARLLFYAEVEDPDRAEIAGACGDYEATALCIEWKYYDTTRRAPMYTSCEPGSGRFALAPRRAVNRDGDGDLSVSLAPVMLSGTGRMTAGAWLASVEVVEDQGQPLRVIKSGAGYLFAADDLLESPALVSKAVSATGVTTFSPGVIHGATRFILQEAPETMPLDLEVDLAWTCGELQTHEILLAPQGYSFELADVGCPVSWPQAFTFRLEPTLLPDTLTIQAYGSLSDSIATPVESTPGGYGFDLLTGPLRVTGTIVSASPNAGAVVDLSEVSWGGVSICTPGTYTLPAEE